MFKFGLLTAILDGWSLEDTVKTASEMGFECLEVACWPKGGAERRYAGTSHIDAERLIADEGYRRNVEDLFAKYHMSISSLAYYPNVLDPDQEKSAACITHLKAVIAASHLLGVNLVTTFIGRNQNLDLEANIELFKNVWPDIISYAESLDTRVAIENCPMLFGRDQWPGGQNLMCTPVVYRRLFEIIPSKNFGLNFDPSHYVWQQMDYVRTLYEFRERIFHIHFKDIKLYPDKLREPEKKRKRETGGPEPERRRPAEESAEEYDDPYDTVIEEVSEYRTLPDKSRDTEHYSVYDIINSLGPGDDRK